MINELLMSSAAGRCGRELCPFDVDMSPLPCRWRSDLLAERDTGDIVFRMRWPMAVVETNGRGLFSNFWWRVARVGGRGWDGRGVQFQCPE